MHRETGRDIATVSVWSRKWPDHIDFRRTTLRVVFGGFLMGTV